MHDTTQAIRTLQWRPRSKGVFSVAGPFESAALASSLDRGADHQFIKLVSTRLRIRLEPIEQRRVH